MTDTRNPAPKTMASKQRTLAGVIRLSLACALFAGCAADATPVRGPDGQTWLSITCRRSQTECYEKAGEECPNGYEVASNSGGSSMHAFVAGGTLYAGRRYDGEMLVKCKSAGKAGP